MRFYRKHIGPGAGVRIGDASRAVMEFLGARFYDGHPRFGALKAMAEHTGPLTSLPMRKSPAEVPSVKIKTEFYASWEWATLRMQVLKANGGRCECCGSTPDDVTVGGKRVRLHVDHIEPLSKQWDLRLESSNLQVLCAECNMGKGAWDRTDWRNASSPRSATTKGE